MAMKRQKLIARHEECEVLRQCLTSPRSEFVIVCGRRRIGKTFLVESFFGGQYDFSFVGSHRQPTRVQLRNFGKALKAYTGRSRELCDWFDAFDALEEHLASLDPDRKKVIFIDEMPWIDTLRSDFVGALENFWNGWAGRRSDIVLVASGSATSWMADNLVDNQGGLHNRITRRIFLKPFTLKDCEEYFESLNFCWDRYMILQSYMLTGGVPYYLSLLDPKLSVAQNIDALCFAERGELRGEYDELYNALFVNAEAYKSVVRLLYDHKTGLTRADIAKALNMNGSRLTRILKNLEQCDFVMRMGMFGKKSTTVYRLADFYTIFYFKFIEGNDYWDAEWWSHNIDSQQIVSWQGLSFELICIYHHRQIKKALGIAGIGTAVSTWYCKPDKKSGTEGAQIDMIIARADRIVHLCEMKYSRNAYNITADYEAKLRRRMWLFQLRTRETRPLVHTFVTTFGLGDGKHRSIVHSEVTMNDLFEA